MQKTFCDCCGKEVAAKDSHLFVYPSNIDPKQDLPSSEEEIELCNTCMLKAVSAALKELQKIKKATKEKKDVQGKRTKN